jgi:hypothetical protein
MYFIVSTMRELEKKSSTFHLNSLIFPEVKEEIIRNNKCYSPQPHVRDGFVRNAQL